MTRRMTGKNRKVAIVQAALPLFARKGFAKTTTRDLAQAAGVSEPLLYRHFPSKEALYLEIQNFSCKGMDPAVKRLLELETSTGTLVRLVYYLLRLMILALPMGPLGWETRCRLMANSFLEDGGYARVLFKTRFESFCAKLEACREAAIAAGDAVRGGVTNRNAVRFAHHVGAYIALAHLPKQPVIDYQARRQELLEQAAAFVLRGMGLTDVALQRYLNAKALARMTRED